MYDDRNTIAHQYFKLAAAGDGIIFSVVHVNGGAAPIEMPWTKTKFDDLDNLLEGLMATATRLRGALTDGTFVLRRHDLNWLDVFGQAYTNPHPTSPQATGKTPEEPPEK